METVVWWKMDRITSSLFLLPVIICDAILHHENTDKNSHRKKGMKSQKRIIIYPKDIQKITGKGYKGSWALHEKIKRSLNKSPESLITIDDFCMYTGLEKEDVMIFMDD